MNRYTLSVLVENQPGVLSKVVALFCGAASTSTAWPGPAHDETVSCITIVVNGDEHTLEQVALLNKIIPVIKVRNLGLRGEFVSCGLALVKVQAEPEKLEGMMQLAKLVGAEAVDAAPGLVTYKIAGETEKIENFLRYAPPLRHPRDRPNRADRHREKRKITEVFQVIEP